MVNISGLESSENVQSSSITSYKFHFDSILFYGHGFQLSYAIFWDD